MTAQITDSFVYQEKKYSITGVNDTRLFEPTNYGLQPLPRITSCWRGFVCSYGSLHNRLLLHALQVNLGEEGPPINEVRPEFSSKGMFDNSYKAINLPLDFTGSLLIADGFLRELYVHMGFHPAWKYETVIELVVSQGNLLETRDLSRKMAEMREEMMRSPLEPGRNTSTREVNEWIASTFRQTYRL